MSTDQPVFFLRAHAIATLRQARALAVGSPDRNELRQLAIALRWLERRGSQSAQNHACGYLINGNVSHPTTLGAQTIVVMQIDEEKS